MTYHEMVEHVGADMPTRYYIDGRRVSCDEYRRVKNTAYRRGSVDCLWTRCKPLSGGRLRRTNGSHVVLP